MGSTQRVVRSIPDRSGNNYTKTSNGGKARAGSAVKYMDEKERTQLYKLEDGRFSETDRQEAVARIEETETKYQQHLTFTTQLPGEAEIDQRQAAQLVAEAVQERRPDAEIYAVAVHQQEGGNIHVHVCFGTDTTLRRGAEGDLVHFQHQAYGLEQQLGRELGLTHDRDDDQQQQKHPGGKPLELDPEDFNLGQQKQRQQERQRDHGMDY
ncbi:hypothetical protein [Deinococcus fonticola]|uniref:hypothetical protein n=1 Tax=Deinococcus fonticola TaxID=2528713 RepID=UPI0010750294|nr:hypothetical protein [Deinococcus fonticola]